MFLKKCQYRGPRFELERYRQVCAGSNGRLQDNIQISKEFQMPLWDLCHYQFRNMNSPQNSVT